MVAYYEMTFQEKVDNFFKVFDIEPLNYNYCSENIDKKDTVKCSDCKKCDGIKIYPEIDAEKLLKLISILLMHPLHFMGHQIKPLTCGELELSVLEQLISARYYETPMGTIADLVRGVFNG